MDASGQARTVIVPVSKIDFDTQLGNRCYDMCHRYSQLMADFITWVIQTKGYLEFPERIDARREHYLKLIRGDRTTAELPRIRGFCGVARTLRRVHGRRVGRVRRDCTVLL